MYQLFYQSICQKQACLKYEYFLLIYACKVGILETTIYKHRTKIK